MCDTSSPNFFVLGYPAAANRNYQVQPEWPLIEALAKNRIKCKPR